MAAAAAKDEMCSDCRSSEEAGKKQDVTAARGDEPTDALSESRRRQQTDVLHSK